MNGTSYGFIIRGSCTEERRLVDHAGAFLGYASLDPLAAVEREAYLSAFCFGDDFRELLESTGSSRGFDGGCRSDWLWFDIDRSDLGAALKDARRLALWLVERYRLDDDALLIFFSGSKGFHVGLPSALWRPEPSPTFNRDCRRLAERMGEIVGIGIDTGVYDKVRAFRAPNSRHPKTGLHKRRLTLDELEGLSLDGIRQLAGSPEAFDVPDAPPLCEQARADWLAAAQAVEQGQQAKVQRTANGKPSLNRQTLAYIREGAGEGDRHRLLYSASCNLGEFGCPSALAHALLGEPALDCGLAPKDVHRQIECGLKAAAKQPIEVAGVDAIADAPIPSAPPVADAADIRKQLAALWHEMPTPPVEVAPEQDEGDGHGDAWEHPLDRLGVGILAAGGPYGQEGGGL